MKKLSIKTDAGKIAYLAGGRGRNLVLLHSLNLSAEFDEGTFTRIDITKEKEFPIT